MPSWPLLLPPPAVSTSTSPLRSHGFSLSIVVESPSRRPSPSSCRRGRAILRRCTAPSIIFNSLSRRPSPPIAVVLSVHCCRARAIPRHQGAVAPSLAVEEPSRHPLPLPSRSHCTVPCRQGAIVPSIAIAVKELWHHSLPSRSRCAVHCHQGAVAPYLAIKEPSAVSTDDSGHSSRPSQASHPDGCRVASPHAAAFHLPAPLIVASPFVPLVRPAGCHVSSLLTPSPPICWRLRLSSRHRHSSCPYQASCPAG